jgi:hypothetical protein
MVGCLFRAIGGMLGLACVGYVAVAVPVGRRTLYEHASQIAATRPARELREDLAQAVGDAARRVGRLLSHK